MNQDGVACSCAEQRGSNIKLGWISVEQGMERVEVWSNEGRRSWKCKGFIGVCSSTDRCVNSDSCGSGDRAEAVTVAEEKRKCGTDEEMPAGKHLRCGTERGRSLGRPATQADRRSEAEARCDVPPVQSTLTHLSKSRVSELV